MALLGIARTIKLEGLTFRSNVELVAFAGEEQGLLGSKAYSRKSTVLCIYIRCSSFFAGSGQLRVAGANLTVMVQADMLAYHRSGEPTQLGLPDL
jgi:Zn-dependent M28 family amino/carboxypeptidase